MRLCTPSSQTMKEIEKSTVLMKQAVMHASYYQCQQSFDFLEALIEESDCFFGKEEMKNTLLKFKIEQEEEEDLQD